MHGDEEKKAVTGSDSVSEETTSRRGKAPRIYATVSINGERVEVIGKDSSDASRVLVLSSRGLTSYVHEDDLIQADSGKAPSEYEQIRQELIAEIGHIKFAEWASEFYGDVNILDMHEALAYAKHEREAMKHIW